jgi:hypothetical protein
MTQEGSDVVVTGGGTINTASLDGPDRPHGLQPEIGPNYPSIEMGPTTFSIDLYNTITATGPTNFGTGTETMATTGLQVGDPFGIRFNPTATFIEVPFQYHGTPLTATNTYASQTYASLGVTPGSYTWSWGSGPTADSFTLQIESPTTVAVPEPSTAMGAVVGAVAFLAYGWSRHCRAQRRQAPG